jgi:hypothetical protein
MPPNIINGHELKQFCEKNVPREQFLFTTQNNVRIIGMDGLGSSSGRIIYFNLLDRLRLIIIVMYWYFHSRGDKRNADKT